MTFINSFQSEWLKKKRSLASWLVIVGAFFTPVIIIFARMIRYEQLPKVYSVNKFWEGLWVNSWQSMAIFMLPVGITLAMSLITQLEFKNNTWKQLHTTPQSLTIIYFSKLGVTLVMMVQFFILFNIGIYLSGVVPYLFFSVPYPKDPIPFRNFLEENLLYFVDCLPVITLQYLISLKFKNFLVGIGAGFVLWIVAMASLSWKYGHLIPYTHTMLHYLKVSGRYNRPINTQLIALIYGTVFLLIGYVMYVFKKDKS